MKHLRLAASLSLFLLSAGFASTLHASEWKPLFNGKNLNGWYVVIGNGRREDTNHLVQVHEGAIHMYEDAKDGSPQPVGYLVTSNDYSSYHLKLEYKWGEKRFMPRAKTRRDAGILYHVVGKDGVWPRSVECQIQENDVGDIFTVRTRVTTEVDAATTNIISEITTNQSGVVQTNRSIKPAWLAREQGGVPCVQGVADNIRRVVRNPMNEQPGWNTVEVVVLGDEATYIVNGKTNNHAAKIEQMVNNQWVPLDKGKIALQLEFAEVYYRNVRIKDLSGSSENNVK